MASKALQIMAAALTVALAGCGGATSITLGGPDTDISVAISPRPLSIPVNSTVVFTARASGGTADPPRWTGPSVGIPGPYGSISSSTGESITYTAPATPPISTSDPNPAGQGKVLLGVSDNIQFGYATDAVTFIITAPSVTTNIYPSTATLSLQQTKQFYGAAVGSTNNAVIFQVNGITGGSTALGVITSTGLYTAPYVVPMTGNTVTITVISQADPTKSSSATVTLQ